MQPASFSSRFAAMNLDMLIFFALWQALSMGLEQVAPELATPVNLGLLCLFFSFVYFIYPTRTTGQTLGKKLLSIKVVPQYNAKARLTWGQALLREVVGKWLSSIPFLLGYAWAYFSRDNKAWHDSMSDTYVISLIWEEEKSSAQKLQQVLLAIISVPAGVALILVAFLYTSLPLNSIKEKIETSGIQVGSLTGSLGGGLRFSEIRRQDKEQNFSLASVEVKFNLWSLVTEKSFYIEKVTADEGHIEVPEDFSLMVVFANTMAIIQEHEAGKDLRDFTLGKLHFKNIYFEHNKKVVSHLQELALKSIALVDNELYVTELQFQVAGFKVKATDVKSAFGRIEIGNAAGGVTPEFLPLLKAPVDFHLKGSFGKTPKTIKLDAGLMIDKIKINYEGEKLTATVEKLILNEMFKTSVPMDELDMKLSAQGSTVLEMLSSLNVEYGVKICGNEFKPDPVKGPSFAKADRQFNFKMIPLPVLDFGQVVFAPEATLDDLFGYQLQGSKQILPVFASNQEMLADLCFQKTVAQLHPQELEFLKPLERVVQGGRGSGYAASAVVTSTPAIEKTESMPIAAATPIPIASPAPINPAEMMKEASMEAKNFLKQGKIAEAKALLEMAPVVTEGLSAAELGSFYNMKAWVYLYSSDPSQAAQHFELAFNARQDIGDAEGLQRSNEALKKDQEAQKWLDYIKAAVKANPDLKNQLTQNMQKKLTSEVSAESHP